MTHDEEVILTLARTLRETEERRAAWQKTAEMEQDRANDNERKFKEVVEKLKDEEARCALLQAGEDLSNVEQHASAYEFQVWDCNNVCIEQWGTYDEAVRGAALWETPSSAAPYRVVGVYLDAPRPVLTQHQHVDALVAIGAEEQTWWGDAKLLSDMRVLFNRDQRPYQHAHRILVLPDTGADDAA